MYNQYETRRLYIKRLDDDQSDSILNEHRHDLAYQHAILKNYNTTILNNNFFFNYACYHKKTHQFIGYINGYSPFLGHTLWIQTFFITKTSLRQGYGTEFYKGTITLLTLPNPNYKVYLACYKENIQGIRFWEHLGYLIALKKEKLLIENNIPAIFYIYKTNKTRHI